jgi:hypothetical protein
VSVLLFCLAQSLSAFPQPSKPDRASVGQLTLRLWTGKEFCFNGGKIHIP